MDFSQVKGLTIPEGSVTKITSGGVVLWQKVTSPIPSAYQQVEWVAAIMENGAYIDLGFAFDTAAEITMEVWSTWETGAYGYVFGATESSGSKRCMLTCPYPDASTASMYAYTGSTYKQVTFPVVDKTKNEIALHYQVGNFYGENLTTGVKGSVEKNHKAHTMTSNLYLFAQNYNGAARFGSKRQIGRFSYRDKNGTLICDLYPCYRKVDGVIGMYDIVRDLFLTNAGKGSFKKGADV